MRHVIGLLLAAAVLAAAPAQAQKKCVKGIPCGNTCIAANKTCRVGTPAASPTREPVSTAAPAVPADARWVASSRGQVYYRIGCSGARNLSPANLIYFKTEEEAQKAGYRHSASRGC